MLEHMKRRYAYWLFKQYGFNRGANFEKIPMFYKLPPLWSPSLYGCCEGEQIFQAFIRGLMGERSETDSCGNGSY